MGTELFDTHWHPLTQEIAKTKVDILTKKFAKQDNVNEDLKARNQLEWVQMMNNCKNRAEEIAFSG